MRSNFELKLKKKIARNCLTYKLDFIVIQMSRVNREKGYCFAYMLDFIVMQISKVNREKRYSN